ncbi:MAG: hypothetical protein KDA57_20795 [Planctomycetales bacterium]|nr:hypothetical protein [Planctomycetales bacterium]
MDNVVELTAIFRLPLLWSALFLCVGGVLLGLGSPRFLQGLNAAFTRPANPNEKVGMLDRKVDADRVLLKYARVLGYCALVTAGVLLYELL